MSTEIKIPTVGRQIHFFPQHIEDLYLSKNGCNILPAIVVQSWDNLSINIHIHTMNGDCPLVTRYSVCHKSEAQEGQSYWDWPEIK